MFPNKQKPRTKKMLPLIGDFYVAQKKIKTVSVKVDWNERKQKEKNKLQSRILVKIKREWKFNVQRASKIIIKWDLVGWS